MKKIMVIIFLLVTTMAYGNGRQDDSSPSQKRVEAIERQLVRHGLQEKEAQDTAQVMVQVRFTEEHMVRFNNQVLSGSNQRLTTVAIRNKVHEGAAKGVPPEAILQAATRVRDRYQYAMQLAEELDQNKHTQIGRTYADCLAAGLTRQDGRRITDALHQSSRAPVKTGNRKNLNTETLLTLRDMVRQGISSVITTDLLKQALAHGYDENDMLTLRHTLRNRNMEDLEQAAKQYRVAIENGVPAEGLKNHNYSAGVSEKPSIMGGGQQNSGSTSGGENSSSGSGNDSSGNSGSSESGGSGSSESSGGGGGSGGGEASGGNSGGGAGAGGGNNSGESSGSGRGNNT